VAQLLEARLPEIVAADPELLAHHYTEAGCHAQAVGYWQQAGTRAVQRSANVEAIAHGQHGLELLTALPDTPQRTQHELDFLTTLGPALVATKGYAAPEVIQSMSAPVSCANRLVRPQNTSRSWLGYDSFMQPVRTIRQPWN
jgi:predicted ATPase